MDNITIQKFKFKHLASLIEMLTMHKYEGLSAVDMKTLPKVGFISFHGKVPIAIGFLRRLEPCYAQIDTLASNPFLGSIIRHKGIELVLDTLINEAKVLKLQGIIAHTKHPDVLKRAKELGCHVVDQKIIALAIK